MKSLDSTWKKLINEAKKAQKNAYAPYSKYQVGAALLDDKGRVFSGCNVENASFSVTICAERSAISRMVNEKGKKIKRIAVITPSETPVFPCGVCLQAIAEFSKETKVLAISALGEPIISNFEDLFPFSFNHEKLEG